SITNGTFNSPGGATTAGMSTDQNGNVLIQIFADSTTAPVSITVESISEVGQPGIDFYVPTTGLLNAQTLAAFVQPTMLETTEALLSTGTPPPPPAVGTLS